MMRFFCFFCLCLAFVAVGCTAFGGPAAVSPDEFASVSAAAVSALNEPEAHWIWTILASEIVAIVAGWAYLWLAERLKNSRHLAAVTAIRDAVNACYQEYVRGIKAGRADGKLTLDEKNEALAMAYRTAVESARTRGVELAKVYAKETVLRLIEKYVGQSKAGAVPPPLPDLQP